MKTIFTAKNAKSAKKKSLKQTLRPLAVFAVKGRDKS
jgi:hypothetical protein